MGEKVETNKVKLGTKFITDIYQETAAEVRFKCMDDSPETCNLVYTHTIATPHLKEEEIPAKQTGAIFRRLKNGADFEEIFLIEIKGSPSLTDVFIQLDQAYYKATSK